MLRTAFQFFTIFFVLFASVSLAISGSADSMFVKRLKGWEGVAFLCNESGNIKYSLCTSIETDAEFLATTSGIKLSKVKSYSEAYDLQDKNNYLVLVANVELVASSSTNNRCRTCAYFVTLDAYAFYVHGIDVSPNNLPNSPVTIPRSGDFVLWEQHPGVVFSGPWESGSDLVIKSVEEHLKRFFILFMKANPK